MHSLQGATTHNEMMDLGKAQEGGYRDRLPGLVRICFDVTGYWIP